MASTERSLGWATSGTGDGPAGGYDSSRWRANAQKSDGTGITLFGSYMAMSGLTTSTLTIADGAAIINGYTYETNGSVTISTSGLTGTYNVLLVANNTAGTVTVTQTGAGGTTVAASTIRAAVATTAQTSTITTAVGAANVITLGTVTVAAGVISTITPAFPFSTSLQVPSQVYGILDSPSSISVPNSSNVDITGYGISATSGEGLISVNSTTGVATIALAGLYLFEARCTWDSNTTGQRQLLFATTGVVYTMDGTWQNAPASSVANSTQIAVGIVAVTAGATVKAQVFQTSGTTRTIGNAVMKIVRL